MNEAARYNNLGMASPNYRRRHLSSEQRLAKSKAARRRLGIPDGHVRIYGLHIPEGQAEPLRSYAAWVCKRRGRAAAIEFVKKAVERAWQYEKPSPPPCLPKIARAFEVREIEKANRRLRRLARGLASSGFDTRKLQGVRHLARVLTEFAKTTRKRRGADWDLIKALLDEYTTPEEVAAFVGIGVDYMKYNLKIMERKS